MSKHFIQKFSVLFPRLLQLLPKGSILTRSAGFSSSSDLGWPCTGPEPWRSAWAQPGAHCHCPEDILALFPCVVQIRRGSRPRRPQWLQLLAMAVMRCPANFVSLLSLDRACFSVQTQGTSRLLLTCLPQTGLMLKLRPANGWHVSAPVTALLLSFHNTEKG